MFYVFSINIYDIVYTLSLEWMNVQIGIGRWIDGYKNVNTYICTDSHTFIQMYVFIYKRYIDN